MRGFYRCEIVRNAIARYANSAEDGERAAARAVDGLIADYSAMRRNRPADDHEVVGAIEELLEALKALQGECLHERGDLYVVGKKYRCR